MQRVRSVSDIKWTLAAAASRVRDDSLLRNSLYIMATTIATSSMGFLYWVIAAHIYSVSAIGLASALLSVIALTSTFSNLGVGSALIQVLPGRASGHDWSLSVNAGLVLGMGAGGIGGCIAVSAVLLFPALGAGHLIQNPIYAIEIIAGAALWNVGTVLDNVFIAERAAGNMFMRHVCSVGLRIPLLWLPFVLGSSAALVILTTWLVAMATAGGFALLILVPRLRRAYHLTLKGARTHLRATLSSFVGHHFITIGGVLPVYLLPLIVTARLSSAANAYFYTTWMVAGLFFMVSPAVASALFAEGSYTQRDLTRRVLMSALLIAVLLGVAAAVMMIAGRHILAFFGPAYALQGLPLLLPLAASAFPDAVTNIYVSVLRIERRLPLAAVVNIGMAAIATILAWFLVPKLGIVGAGWSWLIAQTSGTMVACMHALLAVGRRLNRQRKATIAAQQRDTVPRLTVALRREHAELRRLHHGGRLYKDDS